MAKRGILLALIVILLDQLSKQAILSSVVGQGKIVPVMPSFNLVLVWNKGISFGMFTGWEYSAWIFTAIAVAITLFLLRWMVKSKNLYMVLSLGLVIGGAIGNVIDRLRYGAVVDFLDFYVGRYHWPAFNVADSAIVVGVIVIGWIEFTTGIKEKKQKDG